jgi:hypothetical protein
MRLVGRAIEKGLIFGDYASIVGAGAFKATQSIPPISGQDLTVRTYPLFAGSVKGHFKEANTVVNLSDWTDGLRLEWREILARKSWSERLEKLAVDLRRFGNGVSM